MSIPEDTTDVPAKKAEAFLSSSMLLTQAIDAWEIYLKDQKRSPHTIKAFIADVKLLTNIASVDHTIGQITTKELNYFLDWVESGQGKNVPCSPKTLARRITSIKAFFRWLHQKGILLVDPAEKVVQKSVLSPTPEVLTPEEIEVALAAANQHRSMTAPGGGDARPYALFTLLLHTGIKKSECLTLTLNHVELESPSGPFIFVRYDTAQNRYKERKISLPDEWIPPYQEYIDKYKPKEKIFPWSPRRLEYLLEDISNEAGLTKHISFAMCRWTCALNDWRDGMEHEKIRQKLGVSKIQWREIRMKLDILDRTT